MEITEEDKKKYISARLEKEEKRRHKNVVSDVVNN